MGFNEGGFVVFNEGVLWGLMRGFVGFNEGFYGV